MEAANLAGRYSVFAGVDEKPPEQVQGHGGRVRDNLLQRNGRVLTEGDLVVVR